MSGESINAVIPEVVAYHSEHLEEIRRHTSGYVEVCHDGKEFFATGSCHSGYLRPILNAHELLWNPDDQQNAITHLSKECRSKFTGIEKAGFSILERFEHTAEWYNVETETYLRYCAQFRRATNTLRDVAKEMWDRSRLLLRGKRNVPQELQETFEAFAREIMVLRSCAGDEDIFRSAMRQMFD